MTLADTKLEKEVINQCRSGGLGVDSQTQREGIWWPGAKSTP